MDDTKGFNITQGIALLLLKPLNLPTNYVLNLIIFITNPKNNIGYQVFFLLDTFFILANFLISNLIYLDGKSNK